MTRHELDPARVLLEQHRVAGLLSPGEVHVALTLTRLVDDVRPEVALAVAYATRAPRHGDVAVDLTRIGRDAELDRFDMVEHPSLYWPHPDGWLAAMRSSPLVTASVPAVVVRGTLVFLQRYDHYEHQVATQVLQRTRALVEAPNGALMVAEQLLQGDGAHRQLAAVRAACTHALSLIIGGPGTGKTTTVAALLAELMVASPTGTPPRVALAAPTGKAAARLGEAVRHAAQALPDHVRHLIAHTPSSTLHRLLGWSTRGTPRYHRHRPLPHDMVIIDETSMVSLPLMARVLDAVRPDARLVLVGDAGQLASVDAGNVLGDLVAGGAQGPLAGCLTELDVSRRFHDGSPLDVLARAVRAGDTEAAVAALRTPAVSSDVRGQITWIELAGDSPEVRAALTADVEAAVAECVEPSRHGDAVSALQALSRFRVLAAHRHGPYGVSTWNRWIESLLDPRVRGASPWYAGRPVMVTRNDTTLGLYNGDLGVVVIHEDTPMVAFGATDTADDVRLVAPWRLDTVDTVHAMTIHKSQGSEFRHVVVVLPPAGSPMSSRDLLYTAMTRATHHVTVIGREGDVRSAVDRRSHRTGALAERLAAIDQAPSGAGEVP
jgi:exodeoxyribonuclease V alpha subunit